MGCRRPEAQVPNVRPPSDFDHPVLPEVRISENDLLELRAAFEGQNEEKVGELLARSFFPGESDVFASRGPLDYRAAVAKTTELFAELDPNRAANLGPLTKDQILEGVDRTFNTIVSDLDLATPAGQAELVNFFAHVARNAEELPYLKKALDSFTMAFHHRARELAQISDASEVVDAFTIVEWKLRQEAFVALEGARKGIKTSSGRLQYVHQLDSPFAELPRMLEEAYQEAQEAAARKVGVGLEDAAERAARAKSEAGAAWEAAAEKAGAPPGTVLTPGETGGIGSVRARQGEEALASLNRQIENLRTEIRGIEEAGGAAPLDARLAQQRRILTGLEAEQGRVKRDIDRLLRAKNRKGNRRPANVDKQLAEKQRILAGLQARIKDARKKARPPRAKSAGPRHKPYERMMAHRKRLLADLEARVEQIKTRPYGQDAVKAGLFDKRVPKRLTKEFAEEILRREGGIDRLREEASRWLAIENADLKAKAEFARGSKLARAKNATMEFWINSILSGPITQTVNALSNLVTTAYRPLEDIAIGLGRKAIGLNDEGLVEGGMIMLGQMMEGTRTALALHGAAGRTAIKKSIALKKMALITGDSKYRLAAEQALDEAKVGPVYKALINNTEVTARGGRQFDLPQQHRAISGDALGLQKGTMGYTLVDAFGSAVNLPSRVLSTMDELSKAVNYRMQLAKLAHRYAQNTGDFATTYTKVMNDAPRFFMLDPKVADPEYLKALREMHTQAQHYAKVATFTDELGPGLTKALQHARNHSAFAQFAVPFVRTPANLIKFVGERTPGLARISARHMADLRSADKAIAAAAKGREVVGVGLWLTAGSLALSGRITGGGPSNPDERAVWLAAGNQPFSVKTHNADGTVTHTSYNRLDPFGMFLGIAADLVETMGMTDHNTMDEVAWAALTAGIKNLTSKSYFQGAANMLDGLTHPDKKLETIVQRSAASFVPNILASTNRTGLLPGQDGDPAMREVRGLLDAIRARIPGLSKDLPPRRNLFGEVINYPPGYGYDTISPFFQSTTTKSPIAQEASRLAERGNFSFNMRRYYSHLEGVELTAQQSDEFIQLAAKDLTRNGRTLKDALDRLVQSDSYKRAGDGVDGRPTMIKEVIGRYHRRARKEMLRRHPELRAAVRELELQRRREARTPTPLQTALRG